MFKDVFPTGIDPSASEQRQVRIAYALGTQDALPADLRRRAEVKDGEFAYAQGNAGNSTVTITEFFEDDLKDLKAKLAAKHIRLGTLIDVGNAGGIVYNLLDQKGEVIPSVVLRIDTAGMTPAATNPNPAIISQLHREQNDTFMATIVPRGQPLGREITQEEAERAMAVVNTDGLLDRLKDLSPRQFMKIPGIDGVVLTDISCMADEQAQGKATGTVREFCEMLAVDIPALRAQGMPDGEIEKLAMEKGDAMLKAMRASRVSDAEMEKLRGQQAVVRDKALADLRAAGVDIDPVPTQQQGAKLEPGHEQQHATHKG